MSDFHELSYAQGKMLTYDAAIILEAIAADLRQGFLPLAASGEGAASPIALPAEAKLEIAFKAKVKPGKSKHKLAIEIRWKQDEALTEETTSGTADPAA